MLRIDDWVFGHGERLLSINPAIGEMVAEAKEASHHQVKQAVDIAKKAGREFALLPLDDRLGIIEQYGEILERNQDSLARLISEEMGKPFWESKAEVAAMRGKIGISIKAHKERTGTWEAATATVRHKPLGVLAVIGPYNFPGHLPNGHIIPALIAGNSVVFKPSDKTPKVGEMIVRYLYEAGLPDGVVTLLQGGAQTAQDVIRQGGVNGVLFTGSAHVGAAIHRQLKDAPEKLLALECGGNNPLIAWDVDDSIAAAYQILLSSFATTGQRCTCARRLIVKHGSEGDAIVGSLLALIGKLNLGPWNSDPAPFMGPVATAEARDHLLQAQQERIESGGLPILEMKGSGHAYITPGIIDMTRVDYPSDEEVFGPLVQLYRARDFETALELAGKTTYGLSAGLIGGDKSLYNQFFTHIDAGIINWNVPTTGASSAAPFGGIGISGNYRPSAYYAADYCAYPIASTESPNLKLPEKLTPGITL